MIVVKITYVVILLIYCVKSSDVSGDTNNKVRSANRLAKRYNYHHPPSESEFYSIPVAVVFEDGNRKDKSIDASEMKVTDNPEKLNISESSTEISNTENKTNDPVIESQDQNVLENLVDKSKDDSVNVKNSPPLPIDKDLKQVPHTEMELQIPVVVIYDPVPEMVLSRNKNKSNRRRQRKGNSDSEHLNINPRAVVGNVNNDNGNTSHERSNKTQVPILTNENYVFSHNGEFHYSYEGGDGTRASERGELKSIGESTGESVVGSFSYIADTFGMKKNTLEWKNTLEISKSVYRHYEQLPRLLVIGKDGNDYSLSYTADENGYRPVGDHLPTPPPIPPAIARALKYLATKTTPEPVTEAIK